MNKTDMLLVQLMEECAEIQEACSKALRFGLTEVYPIKNIDNAARINEELIDLFGVVDQLSESTDIKLPEYHSYIEYHAEMNPDIAAKITKINKYLDYSKEVGRLTA